MFLLFVNFMASAETTVKHQSFNTIAFYYGANPPLEDLQRFRIAVVEPTYVKEPRLYARSKGDDSLELFAYVSLGEIQPSRPYYKKLPQSSLKGTNDAWGSRVVDQTAPGWTEFFVKEVVSPLWEQGWRGLFVDTLDSYQIFAKTDEERATQVAAMAKTLQAIMQQYPDMRLILNRGFEMLPVVSDITFAVAAESLYQGYDAKREQYQSVSKKDRAWLLTQLETVRDQYGLPVVVIDYVDPTRPNSQKLARKTADRIRKHSFIPWVADGHLMSIGLGNLDLRSTGACGQADYLVAEDAL